MRELPRGWAWTTVGESAPARYGKALRREDRDPSGSVAVVGSAGSMDRTTTALVNGPCVVVGRKGNIGHPRLIETPSWPIDTTYYLEPAELLSRRYLFHILRSVDFAQLNQSTTTPSLRREELEAISIPLPPLAEQHRIVEVLEDHLSRIDAAEVILVSLARRIDALTDVLAIDALRSSTDSGLPAGWEWRSLESLSSGSSYGTSMKCDTNGEGTAVVRIPNIRDGALNLHDLKQAVDPDADLTHLHLTAGDLLVVRTNGSPSLIGRTAVVRESLPIAFASYLIRFQLGSAEIGDWVHLVLSSPQWRRQIVQAAASSAGQYNLNQSFLKRLQIPLPPKDVRDEILRVQSEIGSELNRLKHGICLARKRAAALRRSLLRAAFDGELVDQDPNDEPADVALARLRDEAKPTPKRAARRASTLNAEG